MKISFCITCYDKDVHFLDACLDSVSQQTVKPDEVIVVSSGFDWDKKIGSSKKLDYVVHNSPSRKFAGWARNRGAEISTGDIITFCDVDDKIHPQRCEYIKSVFRPPLVSALVGSYYFAEEFESWKDLNLEFENLPVEVKEYDVCLKTPKGDRVGHGHLTCRTDMFSKGKMRYKEHQRTGQDSEFCRRICDHPDYKIFYTPQELVIYYPSAER